jgi:glycosyltransferase involved in cell wall biosynthesis
VSAAAPRVLVLGTVLGQPMGGVRRHNAELLPRCAELLVSRGGALAVMEGREPAAFPLQPPIERIATDVAARPLLSRWRREGAATRLILARAQASGRPFELVHTAHLPAPGRLKVPFTITVHDLRRADARAPRAVLASALRRAARVITVSEAIRSELIERFGLDPAGVKVVSNAADHFRPLPREPARGAPLLHVGHLERRKNVELLLRALALDAGLPPLLLAGAAKGGEEARLRGLARQLGVESRTKFLGAFGDEELPRLYARAACAVLPSTIEGFGIPALEAQAAGVPLAIARTPALVEVAGPATPVFDPQDPADCARAIRAAIAAPPASIERAKERASRFRWEASARALVEVWTGARG